ncbi:hypothetical protein [Streptomyces sp. NPDC057253]|uniref:hypothetical protein n=1 Tax=Streptomyces sp. NPDC057253 TaxID=3346069 RepID=UPI00362E64CA
MQFDSKAVRLDQPRLLARYRRFLTIKIVGGACSALGTIAVQALLYAIQHQL